MAAPPTLTIGQVDVEEVLRSPPTTSAPLIANEDVATGSYRRPSLPSPTAPIQNVTACLPLSPPGEESKGEDVSERGGRRRMLRSGTSGSITPLPAPSPDATRTNSSSSSLSASSSRTGLPTASATATSEATHQQPSPSPSQPPSDPPLLDNARPALLHFRTVSSLLNPGSSADTASIASRTDRFLSIFATPAAEELFRSPSQMSSSSDADGYFTARPSSPADQQNDLLSLSILRTQSAAKSRSTLRHKPASWSARSYSAASSDLIDSELAPTLAATSIHDEACFVDGEPHFPVSLIKTGTPQGGIKRIDFLSLLPPELSLCIIFHLSSHLDLLSSGLVSKRWRALAQDQTVWRHLFFAQPGWAIREDAPLVLQHQEQLRRIEAQAKRTAAREEAERLKRLQEQRKAASTSSPYLDRLAALKSWRETLHIPSFPILLAAGAGGNGGAREVDVDSGRPIGGGMSPLRSATAATGRFGLFLSPARPTPSTPAGTRRAQEAASYFSSAEGGVGLSRQPSTSSSIPGHSRRESIDSTFAEVIEAEEFFAASLDWIRLYKDRFILEQRWMRPHPSAARKTAGGSRSSSTQRTAGDGEMSRTLSSTSTTSASTPPAHTQSSNSRARVFEPTKRFLRGHTDSVYCIRQDDGVGTGTAGKLVSGSRDRTIRVWDVETRVCKHILKGHTASVLSLQYDERILVSVSSDGVVFVWDFASILATSNTTPPTTPWTEAPASSKVEVDPESGALIHHSKDRLHCILRGHTSAVLDVVFDSNWIVTGSKDATVRVWRRCDLPLSPSCPTPSSSTSLVAWRKFTHSGPVNAVDLQHNQVVSASGEGSMYLWDLNSGEKLHKFSGHTKGLACIVFKGTTLVSGSNDQTIRVWDTSTGKCTHVLGEHHMLVRTVAFDAVRGVVVSGGYDRLVKVWHIDPPSATTIEGEGEVKEADEGNTVEGNEGGDGQEGTEGEMALGRCLRDIKCHRARIFDVDFNTTRIVSASEDHLICITSFGGQGIDASLFA